MINSFQINTVYSDFDNGLWKVSLDIQYLCGNYLSSLPIIKKNMHKLLFILFIIKLYAQINIFKRLKFYF